MVEGFATRHRFLLVALWAHVPLLALIGLLTDQPIAKVGGACLILIAAGVAAMLLPGVVVAASATALGLAVAASMIVRFSGDSEVIHLYFAVVVAAVAFYRDVRPVLTALADIAAYHLVVGLWSPGDQGLVWAAAHTGMLTLLALTLVMGWRLTATDVHERSLSTDRYRTSFGSASIGMAVLKLSGQLVEVNESLATMLGHGVDHLTGRNIRAFVHTDDMPLLGDAWEEMGNSPSHTAAQWMRCMTSDGGSVWTKVTLALVPRSAEQSALVILQAEDATTNRQEQTRLEDLIRGKDEFVATVGHEIREPLGVLIDLTDDGDPGLRDINARVREVAAVVDDLIVSARADVAPQGFSGTEFDIAAACRAILRTMPGGEQVPVDDRARWVWAEPELATQILTSMLGNSLRYGGAGVRVQIFNSGPDTVVQMIDAGPEIAASQRDRIFTSDLRQGLPVTKPATVGLSLTVGRHLARRMEGDIGYRRSGDGLNIFELRLPSEEITKAYAPRPRPRLTTKA